MVTEILLAAFNGEKYLAPQVESLLSQEEKCPILCRDDGSSDHTMEILKRYPVRIVTGPPTGSPQGNFLELIKESRGDYLFFADQDDVWKKEKTRRLLAKMREGEKRYGAQTPLLVHCDLLATDESGEILYPSLFRHQQWDPAARTLPRLLVQNNVTGCAMLVNRPLKDLMQKARAEDMYMHDWWAALLAASFGRILFVDEPLVCYRQHGDNQKGASRAGMARRAGRALAQLQKGKDRVALTYRNAEAFYRVYQEMLPAEAKACIQQFLKIPKKGKIGRVFAILKGGYRMQSAVTRWGHLFFC